MAVPKLNIQEGQRYRHKWSGALVKIKKLMDNTTVLWQTLDDYRIDGHTWGAMQPFEFAKAFDHIGSDYHLGRVG